MDLLKFFLQTLPYTGPLIGLCGIALYLPKGRDRLMFGASAGTWLLAMCLWPIGVRPLTTLKQNLLMAIAFGIGYLVPIALTPVTIIASQRSSTGRAVQLTLSLMAAMLGLAGTAIVYMFALGAACKLMDYCV
jgi:hypothetical protein